MKKVFLALFLFSAAGISFAGSPEKPSHENKNTQQSDQAPSPEAQEQQPESK